MSYATYIQMANNGALIERVAGCAAEQGETVPYGWAAQNIWAVVSRSDWVAAWAYAEDAKTNNVNPDTGARTDVINDGMILSAVQDVRGT